MPVRGRRKLFRHLSVRIADGLAGLEDESEAEVRDAGRHVRLDQHVLALEVSVCDGRLHFLE